jgi:hypothetical protein
LFHFTLLLRFVSQQSNCQQIFFISSSIFIYLFLFSINCIILMFIIIFNCIYCCQTEVRIFCQNIYIFFSIFVCLSLIHSKLKFIIVIKFIVFAIEMTESTNGNCFINYFILLNLIVGDFYFNSTPLRHRVR